MRGFTVSIKPFPLLNLSTFWWIPTTNCNVFKWQANIKCSIIVKGKKKLYIGFVKEKKFLQKYGAHFYSAPFLLIALIEIQGNISPKINLKGNPVTPKASEVGWRTLVNKRQHEHQAAQQTLQEESLRSRCSTMKISSQDNLFLIKTLLLGAAVSNFQSFCLIAALHVSEWDWVHQISKHLVGPCIWLFSLHFATRCRLWTKYYLVTRMELQGCCFTNGILENCSQHSINVWSTKLPLQ